MIIEAARPAVLLLALLTTAVFAQDTPTSQEFDAKALFYSASGATTQVSTARESESPAQGGVSNVASSAGAGPAKRTQPGSATRPLALRASVLLVVDGGKTVELKPSHKFHTGDRVKLAFSTSKAGYFYLATIGSSGAVQILAPRVGEPVRVEAGNRYTFPSSPTGFFRFDSTKGQEVIWAVLSDEPLAAINMGSGLTAQLPQQSGSATSSESTVAAGKVVAMADVASEFAGKDLVFEEDSTALFASVKPASFITGSNNKPPVVVKLVLKHQ